MLHVPTTPTKYTLYTVRSCSSIICPGRHIIKLTCFQYGLPTLTYSSFSSHPITLPSSGRARAMERQPYPVNTPAICVWVAFYCIIPITILTIINVYSSSLTQRVLTAYKYGRHHPIWSKIRFIQLISLKIDWFLFLFLFWHQVGRILISEIRLIFRILFRMFREHILCVSIERLKNVFTTLKNGQSKIKSHKTN